MILLIVRQYSIDSKNYFNSKADYEAAQVVLMICCSHLSMFWWEDSSDNTFAGGNGPNDVPGYQSVDDMIHTKNNAQIKQLWDWMFAGVRELIHSGIQGQNRFWRKESNYWTSSFLKSLYHFELVKWFGGIPMNGDKRLLQVTKNPYHVLQLVKYMLQLKQIWFMRRKIWVLQQQKMEERLVELLWHY
jgi:hypothetical protein